MPEDHTDEDLSCCNCDGIHHQRTCHGATGSWELLLSSRIAAATLGLGGVPLVVDHEQPCPGSAAHGAFPGLHADNAALTISSHLQATEINAFFSFLSGPNGRLSLLTGFRFLDLHERLSLTSSSVGIPGGGLAGFTNIQDDIFETRNLF